MMTTMMAMYDLMITWLWRFYNDDVGDDDDDDDLMMMMIENLANINLATVNCIQSSDLLQKVQFFQLGQWSHPQQSTY